MVLFGDMLGSAEARMEPAFLQASENCEKKVPPVRRGAFDEGTIGADCLVPFVFFDCGPKIADVRFSVTKEIDEPTPRCNEMIELIGHCSTDPKIGLIHA